MPTAFKFLFFPEFMALNPDEKLAYISAATVELERTKLDRAAGGWHKLFRQDHQEEQQQQPQPKSKSDPR